MKTAESTMTDDQRARYERDVLPQAKSLLKYAYSLTGNFPDAEDLTQDTLLKAFRKFHQYQDGTNIRAWLFTILKSNFISDVRKANRQPQKRDSEWETEADTASFSPGPDIELLETALDERMVEALNALPEQFREALFWVDFQGFTLKDAAAMLDRPSGTLMSQVYRGRRKLLAALQEGDAKWN